MATWTLLFSVTLCGAAWHDLRWSRFDDGEIGRYAPFDAQPVCVDAVALESPDRISAPQATPLRAIPAGERSRLVVHVTAIRDGTHWRQASGICQLTVNGHLLGVRPDDQLANFRAIGTAGPAAQSG